jgi:hypothetical protein
VSVTTGVVVKSKYRVSDLVPCAVRNSQAGGPGRGESPPPSGGELRTAAVRNPAIFRSDPVAYNKRAAGNPQLECRVFRIKTPYRIPPTQPFGPY